VERRVGPVTKDLFGYGDILAIDPTWKVRSKERDARAFIVIQTTSTSNMASRVKKTRELCHLWLDVGGRVLVWGWAMRGKAGQSKRWTLKEEEIHDGSDQSVCGDGLGLGEA